MLMSTPSTCSWIMAAAVASWWALFAPNCATLHEPTTLESVSGRKGMGVGGEGAHRGRSSAHVENSLARACGALTKESATIIGV